MPTQRKRIGFLPRAEVQKIIDKISNHNNLSQSKVTGMLVEEALSSRGIIKSTIKRLSYDFTGSKSNFLLTETKTIKSDMANDEDNLNLDDGSINDEVRMINEFIEFKLFKNIMKRNKKRIKF